jgi:hypothetical protein
VKELELPFHRWYKWLEDKFTDLRVLEMDNKSNRSGSFPKNPYGRSLTLTSEEFKQNSINNPEPPRKKTPKGMGLL